MKYKITAKGKNKVTVHAEGVPALHFNLSTLRAQGYTISNISHVLH